MQANVLVTGGAGYIGSNVVNALFEAQAAKIIVLDDLSTGFAKAVRHGTLVQGSVHDKPLIERILSEEKINTVYHFAGSTIISESLENPLKYYHNNAMGTLSLLEACTQHAVQYFIYSSSAAVYGPPQTDKVAEDHPLCPLNPYARSKLMGETMINDCAQASGLQYAILRYFNVAGADSLQNLGQFTTHATHLIKNAVQTAVGAKTALPIYGNDYATPDGTCIRDFIHVSDLADAHVQALRFLMNGGENFIANCGYGRGFSVQDVIKALEAIIDKPLSHYIAARREGDLAAVVADNTKIKKLLSWSPKFDNLTTIVKSALDFELAQQ